MLNDIKPMRILTLAPPLWSGAGNATLRLAKELNNQGHHIQIAASASTPEFLEWKELAEALAGEGIHLHAVRSASHFDANIPKLVEELTDLIGSQGFDIIHAHSGITAQAALEARLNSAVTTPIVTTIHDWNSIQPTRMNECDIRALDQCEMVVSVSRQQAQLLKAWGVSHPASRTIYWGTDLAPRRLRIPNRPLPGSFRIVSMSPIAPPADLRTLIRAFSEFHGQVKRSELIIAGPVLDERYLAALHQFSNELKVRHSVHFVGQIDDPSLWLRDAHLYVSTALNNPLCLMLIDALGYGLPCACTRIEGHLDIAEEGVAMLAFEPGDPHDLARRMSWTQEHPNAAARLGENARLTASLKYSWRRVAESYLAAYASVCRQINAVAA